MTRELARVRVGCWPLAMTHGIAALTRHCDREQSDAGSNPEKTTRRLNTTLKDGLPRGFQPLAMTGGMNGSAEIHNYARRKSRINYSRHCERSEAIQY